MTCFTRLYVDLIGYDNPALLFKPRNQHSGYCPNGENDNLAHRARPDIVINQKDRIIVIELTIPYETNLISSREFKIKRYENLRSELIDPCKTFELVCV